VTGGPPTVTTPLKSPHRPKDNVAPQVSITAPAPNAVVSGTVTVSALATDNVGVTQVTFAVDGMIGAVETVAPYVTSWDTTQVANGAHTLTVVAYDAAGNTGQVTIAVSVQNLVIVPPPVPLVLTCPGNQFATSAGGAPVNVTYPAATTTGGTGAVVITYSIASGSAFPVGTTTVHVAATDSGTPPQVTSCSFTVTVTVAAPTRTLIGLTDLLWTGMYRTPDGVGTESGDPGSTAFATGALAVRYVAGQRRFLMATFRQASATTGRDFGDLIEYTVPAAAKYTGATPQSAAEMVEVRRWAADWTLLDTTPSWWSAGASVKLGGLYWDETQQGVWYLLYGYYQTHNTPFLGFTALTDTVDPVRGGLYRSVGTRGGPWWYRAANPPTDIPYWKTVCQYLLPVPASAQSDLGGRTFLVGAGVGAVGGIGHLGIGFHAFAALPPITDPPNTVIPLQLRVADYTTESPISPPQAHRDTNYTFVPYHQHASADTGLWPAAGGVGYWQMSLDQCNGGAWVETATKQGLVLFGRQVSGDTAYGWNPLSQSPKYMNTLTASGTTATATFVGSPGHQLTEGATVRIVGVLTAGYNGVYTAHVVDSNTITVTLPAAPAASPANLSGPGYLVGWSIADATDPTRATFPTTSNAYFGQTWTGAVRVFDPAQIRQVGLGTRSPYSDGINPTLLGDSHAQWPNLPIDQQIDLGNGVAQPTAIFYVATTGNDTNPGTLSQPFKTIAHGISVLTPGAFLLIMAGTYDEAPSTFPNGSSWAAPVTIAAYPGDTVIVQPSTAAENVFSFAGTVSYVVLDGLILDGTNLVNTATDWGNCVYVGTAADHIKVNNCELRNAPGQGILTVGGAHFNQFLNLNIHDNGLHFQLTHGIYLESSNNTVSGCQSYNNAAWGIQVYGSDHLPSNNLITGNKVYNNTRLGNGGGIVLSSGTTNVAYNNLIYGNNGGYAVEISFGGGPSNTRVENNTIDNAFGIDIGADSTNATVTNNIVNGAASPPIGDAGVGSTISHNYTAGSPGFVNQAAHNYHLTATSPAVDAGLTIAEVTVDYDGVTRPQGAAYDIGAYEYTTSPPPTPPPPGVTIGSEATSTRKISSIIANGCVWDPVAQELIYVQPTSVSATNARPTINFFSIAP
jgi:parallel beta-helix repeat protein